MPEQSIVEHVRDLVRVSLSLEYIVHMTIQYASLKERKEIEQEYMRVFGTRPAITSMNYQERRKRMDELRIPVNHLKNHKEESKDSNRKFCRLDYDKTETAT